MVFQLINLFPQITKIREKGSQTVNSVLVDKIIKRRAKPVSPTRKEFCTG
jgi:hypothetical protein